MKIGTRVLYPEEVDIWEAELLQISVYYGMKHNLDIMSDCVHACKTAGISYVIHPVGYSMFDRKMLKDLRKMAEITDIGIILHDERSPDGGRIEGRDEDRLLNAIGELRSITGISFENATNTHDVRWFWNTFAGSITLDIGHIESAGLDSVEFVRTLEEEHLQKIRFVHMHRNNGMHGGITDHWPLTAGCREMEALRSLLKVRYDISVILEINEIEMIPESLDILKALRKEIMS
jgi:sugar phosphate isomerase/epimerase